MIMCYSVERMNHTGDGIVHFDNRVVFVKKAIAGDVVRLRDVKNFKNYATASISEIVRGSNKRVPVKCPYYDVCGGCQIMGLAYDEQLRYKKSVVVDIFKRYCDMEVQPNILASSQFGYRNKIVLHVLEGKIGFYCENSNELVEINECLIAKRGINDVLRLIQKEVDVRGCKKIMIRQAGEEKMVVFYGKINVLEVVEKLKDDVSSIYVFDKCVYGKECLRYSIGMFQFDVAPEAFYQVNDEGLIKVYDTICSYLGNRCGRVMDLYCGTGTIGIYCSSISDYVLGVEINKDAVSNAIRNKELNGVLAMDFRCGSVGQVIGDCEKYDVVIVDPPRGGLDKETIKNLLRILSDKIIYVSCNPITLARDVKQLSEKYDFVGLTLIDLFPNSYHVECCTLLRLK